MENLQQIVVQLTTAPYERALAQYGNDFMPQEQKEIIYSDLSAEDKVIFDTFVEMIKSSTRSE
jgi:hypothetical protein